MTNFSFTISPAAIDAKARMLASLHTRYDLSVLGFLPARPLAPLDGRLGVWEELVMNLPDFNRRCVGARVRH